MCNWLCRNFTEISRLKMGVRIYSFKCALRTVDLCTKELLQRQKLFFLQKVKIIGWLAYMLPLCSGLHTHCKRSVELIMHNY